MRIYYWHKLRYIFKVFASTRLTYFSMNDIVPYSNEYPNYAQKSSQCLNVKKRINLLYVKLCLFDMLQDNLFD